MATEKPEWDFFIAHAGADGSAAEQLYDLLAGSAKVFLDTRSLELGDDWDRALVQAQTRSLMSVVLVSSRTDSAYYQREEIAAAIQMARESSEGHRVIPVYLDDIPAGGREVPYGLRVKHGLYVSQTGSLENVAFRLLETLNRLRYRIVLYDGRFSDAFHFKGQPNSFWAGKGTEARPTSPIGEGTLKIDPGGVLTINRTKSEGRFEIWLLDDQSRGAKARGKIFPANQHLSADRKLWVHCEARTDGAKHAVRFILKNEETQAWLANERRTIETTDWTTLDVYFRVDPTRDFWFRIDHEEISKIPTQLQLRGIVLRERMW